MKKSIRRKKELAVAVKPAIDLSSDFIPVSKMADEVSAHTSAQGLSSSYASALPVISDFSRLEKLPCKGSTCETYKWIWNSRVYFVKRLKPEFRCSSCHINAFEKEFELGSKLDHVSLPHYVAFHHSLGECYIVMEYIDGRTLDTLWHKLITADRRVTYRVMEQLIDVLEYLHRHNIMHYDLIPQNVMLTNGLNNVVLIDLDKAFNSAYVNNSGDPSRFGVDANGEASSDVDFRGLSIILSRGFWNGMGYGELSHFNDLCNKPGVTAEELREALSHKYDDVYVSDQKWINGRTCDAFEGDWQLYPVIIKRLKPGMLNNKYYIDKFVNEYITMADLGNPTFASYNLIRNTPEDCFVVIEKPEGLPVSRMLSEGHPWINDTANIKHLLMELLDAFYNLWYEGLDSFRFEIQDVFVDPADGEVKIANFREVLDTTTINYDDRWEISERNFVCEETQEVEHERIYLNPYGHIPFEMPHFYQIIVQLEVYLDLYWLADFKKACLRGASHREFYKMLSEAKPY